MFRKLFAIIILTLITISIRAEEELCLFPPLGTPVGERIQQRSFPSVLQAWDHIVGHEDVPAIALHDLYWSASHSLDIHVSWDLSEAETYGLSTVLTLPDSLSETKEEYERLMRMNPNMVLLFGLPIEWHPPDAFPLDSDFWVRDPDGNLVLHPWHGRELPANILNAKFQDKIIEKAVAIAACGLYDGIYIDGLRKNGTGLYARQFYPEVTDRHVIDAYTRILRSIRERVRHDFLIIANVNRTKPTAYTQYLNGVHMETGHDANGSYTRKGLIEIGETLLWSDTNLRSPQIIALEGEGLGTEPPDGPANLRWMRCFTTMSLTHTDGYVLYTDGRRFVDPKAPHHAHIWYDFWDADLGVPIGEKAREYKSQEGLSIRWLFIREFDNGWAVYNRSGKEQMIQLPEKVSGWHSGVKDKRWHVIPDLDGEIYLKSVAKREDINGDGIVNILDLVIVANGFNGKQPDLNGDGIVNILDLAIVANAF